MPHFSWGAFDTPQVGDPVMADWGIAKGIKSVLQYAVWSDFSPEDTLLEKDALNVREPTGHWCAPREAEEKINLAMSEFKTQAQIIAGLLEQRKERNMEKGMIEVYLSFESSPPRCEYDKYVRRIQEIESKEEK